MLLPSHKKENKIYLSKAGAFFICAVFALSLVVFGLASAFDTDKTVSENENRNLKTMPQITVKSLFDGSFSVEFDEYYADTFPMREKFLSVNRKISDLFSKTSSGDDMVIVEKSDKDDFAGQDITFDEQ